ncbi:MAG TPA: PAC2 family protein [Candidatus Nanoarchaeia archaeon]|nr:PAC2 family protein [Candidatus Nanoarchaeia archaeon]
MTLRIKKFLQKMPHLQNPILIEGLPGIGNVGKVAVDFMVDRLNAKKIMEIYSHSFPHSVFVNEDNLVELPTVELFYKKRKGKRDLIFLAGDIQPLDEESSYEFSHKVLDILKELNGSELITLGGIGLPDIPEKPRVYCTGTSKKMIEKYRKGEKISKNLFGVVGPIVGVTGLLIGLAKEKNINGVCLLAETYGHPLYLGVKGSKEVLKILNKKLSLDLDVQSISKEIEDIEEELAKKVKDINEIMKPKKEHTDYIG